MKCGARDPGRPVGRLGFSNSSLPTFPSDTTAPFGYRCPKMTANSWTIGSTGGRRSAGSLNHEARRAKACANPGRQGATDPRAARWFEVILITRFGRRRARFGGIRPWLPHPLNVRVREVAGTRDVTGLLITRDVGADLVLDSEPAVNLHRSRRNPPELVLDRRARVPLDHDAVHAVMRKQQSRREAVQTATHNQNRCSRRHLSTSPGSARLAAPWVSPPGPIDPFAKRSGTRPSMQI